VRLSGMDKDGGKGGKERGKEGEKEGGTYLGR
jgi:hypothetical protein